MLTESSWLMTESLPSWRLGALLKKRCCFSGTVWMITGHDSAVSLSSDRNPSHCLLLPSFPSSLACTADAKDAWCTTEVVYAVTCHDFRLRTTLNVASSRMTLWSLCLSISIIGRILELFKKHKQNPNHFNLISWILGMLFSSCRVTFLFPT